MAELAARVAKNLIAIRKARNLTQGGLAKLVNVSTQQVNLYENEKTPLSTDRLEEIAKALNVHVDAIIGPEVQIVRREMTSDEIIDRVIEAFRILSKYSEPDLKDALTILSSLDQSKRDNALAFLRGCVKGATSGFDSVHKPIKKSK